MDEDNKKSVMRVIFEWSQKKPLWQRDALRRIVQKVSLDTSDLDELFELILTTQEDITSKAFPLLEEHLPSEQINSDPIQLESISNLKGVNNLAEGQKINFAQSGVTVIYGENGSGKSGYTRILKNSCRARKRAEVLPNVFSADEKTEISSLITYSNGSDKGKQFQWQNNDSPHPILSGISVFDRESASVHIQERNTVAYRPFGLDIPDTLAYVSKELEKKLEEYKRKLETTKNAIFQNPPWSVDTPTGKLVASISKDTNFQEIANLAELNSEEEERLTHLTSSLSDVSKSLKSLDDLAINIDSLIETMETLANKIDDKTIDSLIELYENASTLKKSADVAATTRFAENKLSGVGEKVWQEFWNSAREYSEKVAYVGRKFPASESDDLCLLCQQPLGELGSTNIKKFDEFVKSNVQDRANVAKVELDKARSNFPETVRFGNSLQTIYQLGMDYPDIAKQCMRFYASSRCRVSSTLKLLSGNEGIELEPQKDIPSEELKAIAIKIREKAKELRDIDDADKLAELVAEKSELEDRKIVKSHLKAIEEEVERLKKVSIIENKLGETGTRSITSLGNSIADDIVTPHLRDSFLHEVKEFVRERFEVDMKRVGGKYGSPEYKISFSSDPKRNVSTVLSEGEQTCVAIASFLAEQSTASSKSALIFDDPISSLDHKWRSAVAQRLTLEGKDRQVIIFTHDLVFLNDLEEFSKEYEISFYSMHLNRTPKIAGIVSESLPWDGMKIRDRIDKLEKEARDLKQQRNSLTEEDYKDLARVFYSKLRASWERALEETGLSHTVMRHRDYINPKNVNNISALELQDCQEWSSNYKKCCNFVEAHDGSQARNQALPEPDILEKDVSALLNWVNSLAERHKSIRKKLTQ